MFQNCKNMPNMPYFAYFLSFRGGKFIPWLDFERKNFAAQTLQNTAFSGFQGVTPPEKSGPLFLKTGFTCFPRISWNVDKSGILLSFQRHLQLWAKYQKCKKYLECPKYPKLPQNSAQKLTSYLIFIIQRRKLGLVTWFLEEKKLCRSNIAKTPLFLDFRGWPPQKKRPLVFDNRFLRVSHV